MIHMNMHEMPSVLRTEFSNTSRVIRPLSTAARNAVSAPMAELSTSDVQPLMKGTIMVRKMPMRQQARAQQAQLLGPGRRALPAAAGPSAGLQGGSGSRCRQ
jgi:hypothetical protein